MIKILKKKKELPAVHIDGVCEVVFYKLKMVITILKVKKKPECSMKQRVLEVCSEKSG